MKPEVSSYRFAGLMGPDGMMQLDCAGLRKKGCGAGL